MKILALDTSTEYCSLALWQDGVVSTRQALAGQRHSELVFPMLRELLDESGTRLVDVDGIAYGEGPGSFTGLRIACGIAQGLAFGAGVPVLGIGTLLALAQGAGSDRVIPCIDARMNEVYLAAYERIDGEWQTVTEPCLGPPAAVPAVGGTGWTACGSGFRAYAEALTQRYAGQLAQVRDDAFPQACAVAELAAERFRRGEGEDAASAIPLYIRDKVALKMGER